MKKIILFLIVILFIAQARAQNDLSLAAPFGTIQSPVSGCSLTSTENVTVRIFNFGNTLPAGTSFNVSYNVNAGLPVVEMVVLGSTLLSNSAFTYTFVTQANLSIPGSYTLDATVSLAGDINPVNDAFTNYPVGNSAASVGGTISGSTTACASGNSGALTLSSQTGSVIRWEYSNDNGNTWYYISNTTTTQNYSNLKTTTQYRAVVKNGDCSIAFSSMATITINC